MKSILVVGGAGYVGSYMCKYLAKKGYNPVVLDNLISGHRQAVKWGDFIEGSMSDSKLLKSIFTEYRIEAVMHFAAFSCIEEAVLNPGKYYSNNVAKTIDLLNSMIENNIKYFIFSSSAAIYGESIESPITELHSQNPITSYGRSKLMVEQILKDFSNAYGLKYVSLRYFNVAGADPGGEVGEDHRPETHLIPLVLQTALGQRERIDIFGDDYPTKDGTCIRDYVHIADLAQAHLLALERLINGMQEGEYNLGNGDGFSVKEVIEVARNITGRTITSMVTKRRPGSATVLISSSKKAIRELGWNPQFADLSTIIKTAWEWHKKQKN